MNWLAGWDFPERTAPALPTVVAQLIFALLLTIAMIIVRMTIDIVAPSAGALSLLYPAVMVATLFARWFSGLLTMLMTVSYTIYFVLKPVGSFDLLPNDVPRVIVNITVLAVTILLLEVFRGAIVQANAERDRQIEQSELLLRELDHRVKNNFAAVSGLLEAQRQRATDQVVRDELGAALNRVESIATAHRFLYREGMPGEAIDLSDYLPQLCVALESALLRSDAVKLRCEIESALVERNRAASIGLIVNELVTNAARHAFRQDRSGSILVSLKRVDKALELVVADDGCGMPDEPRAGGLGRRLIAAFAQEARGELQTDSSPTGTRCTVRLRTP